MIGDKALTVLGSFRFDKIGTNALRTPANGFCLDDAETSHAAGLLHMRAPANLHRVIPDLVDFDEITVALTKEGQRSSIKRLLQGHHLYCGLKVTLNLLVHNLLNAPYFLTGRLLRMREIKA